MRSPTAQNVKISGFGTFILRDKGQRVGRNPKTGIEVPIAPRRVMTFRASQIMRDRIARAKRRVATGRKGTGRFPDDRRIVARAGRRPAHPALLGNASSRSSGRCSAPAIAAITAPLTSSSRGASTACSTRKATRSAACRRCFVTRGCGLAAGLRDGPHRRPRSPCRMVPKRDEPNGVDVFRLIELRNRLADALEGLVQLPGKDQLDQLSLAGLTSAQLRTRNRSRREPPSETYARRARAIHFDHLRQSSDDAFEPRIVSDEQ